MARNEYKTLIIFSFVKALSCLVFFSSSVVTGLPRLTSSLPSGCLSLVGNIPASRQGHCRQEASNESSVNETKLLWQTIPTEAATGTSDQCRRKLCRSSPCRTLKSEWLQDHVLDLFQHFYTVCIPEQLSMKHVGGRDSIQKCPKPPRP